MPGTVTVTVTVTGMSGGDVAGVLTPGDRQQHSVDTSIGGFHLAVTSHRFTATATVDTPMPDAVADRPFPYVTSPPVLVPAGTYLLTVWGDRDGLGPYSRWVPAAHEASPGTPGLQACDVVVRVRGNTSVAVTGLVPMQGTMHPCATAP